MAARVRPHTEYQLARLVKDEARTPFLLGDEWDCVDEHQAHWRVRFVYDPAGKVMRESSVPPRRDAFMFEYLGPGSGAWLPLGDGTGPLDVLKMLHLVSGRSAKFPLKGAWVAIRVIRGGNDIGTLDSLRLQWWTAAHGGAPAPAPPPGPAAAAAPAPPPPPPPPAAVPPPPPPPPPAAAAAAAAPLPPPPAMPIDPRLLNWPPNQP